MKITGTKVDKTSWTGGAKKKVGRVRTVRKVGTKEDEWWQAEPRRGKDREVDRNGRKDRWQVEPKR